jgi:hypothetical protein
MRSAQVLPLALFLCSCTDQAPVSPSTAVDESPAFVQGGSAIAIQIKHQARLMRLENGQQFVEITIRAKCPTGHQQLEEPLTLTQGEAAFGQGGFGMICTGQWEPRTFRVFSTGEVEFRRGRARANVGFSVENPSTGALLTASDTETLRLH